jgi:hypothetical protein
MSDPCDYCKLSKDDINFHKECASIKRVREFTFNKYKGSSFGEIINKDNKYITWLLENTSGKAQEYIEKILDHDRKIKECIT